MYGKCLLFLDIKTCENLAHVQTVSTRPFFGGKGPGDDATYRCPTYSIQCVSMFAQHIYSA